MIEKTGRWRREAAAVLNAGRWRRAAATVLSAGRWRRAAATVLNAGRLWFWVIAVLSTVLLAWQIAFHKENFHVDELWTYAHANSTQGAFLSPRIDSYFKNVRTDLFYRWIPGEVFHDYLTVQPEEAFRYGHIGENLAKGVHPPLYYWLLHTVCSFFPDVFSKWQSAGLNLVIWVLLLAVLFKLARLVLPSGQAAAVVGIYAFSLAGFETAAFLRMYLLQTLLFVCLAYETAVMLRDNRADYRRLGLMALYSFLCLMTHYSSLFYTFFMAAATGIILLWRRNFALLWRYAAAMLLSVEAFFAVFPSAIDVLFGSLRGEQSMRLAEVLFSNSFWLQLNRAMVRLGNLFSDKLAGMPSIPAAAWFLVFMLYLAAVRYARLERCPALRWLAGVIVSAGMWLAATMPRMGAFDLRYFMPLCPLVVLAGVLMLRRFGQAFGLSAEQAGRLFILWVVWNATLAVDWRRNPFIVPQTAETKAMLRQISGRKVLFLAAARKNYLAFYMVSDWQKEAGAVYWSSDVCPEKLADEADFVLVYNPLMQGDYFVQRRPERKKLCPELEKKLEFSGQVEAREIYYDWYKPATDKHGEKRGGGR